jgi:hypothetical protein
VSPPQKEPKAGLRAWSRVVATLASRLGDRGLWDEVLGAATRWSRAATLLTADSLAIDHQFAHAGAARGSPPTVMVLP